MLKFWELGDHESAGVWGLRTGGECCHTGCNCQSGCQNRDKFVTTDPKRFPMGAVVSEKRGAILLDVGCARFCRAHLQLPFGFTSLSEDVYFLPAAPWLDSSCGSVHRVPCKIEQHGVLEADSLHVSGSSVPDGEKHFNVHDDPVTHWQSLALHRVYDLCQCDFINSESFSAMKAMGDCIGSLFVVVMSQPLSQLRYPGRLNEAKD